MQRQSSYKVHMNTISNGDLSDPLCDSVNRGPTSVRLCHCVSFHKGINLWYTCTCIVKLNFFLFHFLEHVHMFLSSGSC